MGSPVRAFHSRTKLFLLPVSTHSPSGLNATAVIHPPCGMGWQRGSPVRASHSRVVPFLLPVTIRSPSGLNAKASTTFACDIGFPMDSPVAASHNRAVPFARQHPLAIRAECHGINRPRVLHWHSDEFPRPGIPQTALTIRAARHDSFSIGAERRGRNRVLGQSDFKSRSCLSVPQLDLREVAPDQQLLSIGAERDGNERPQPHGLANSHSRPHPTTKP